MKHTVLIVDDCPSTLGMLSAFLEQSGFTALICMDGEQALNISMQMQPSIIILDAIMPGLDGFETCKKLKSTNEINHIPVIFMTGLTESGDVLRGFEAGGVDYVTKPIDQAELVARIKVHLANAQLTQSAHTALDSTGQFMVSVNKRGDILWMTPQVSKLLKTSDQSEYDKLLKQEIAHWLSHKPEPGMNLSVKTDAYVLRLIMQGQTDDEAFLLRIVDNDDMHKRDCLKNQFQLTNREAEVLLWLTLAKTNREIARILGSSPGTINKHTEHIFKKLEVENRTAAAGKAIRVLSA